MSMKPSPSSANAGADYITVGMPLKYSSKREAFVEEEGEMELSRGIADVGET